MPSTVLGHHLEDLISLVKLAGYKHGILLQLNNLDIGVVHEEKYLQYLFNALRDYIQTRGISWLFVGDVGLRQFIAQHVDRLDDIVSYEVDIQPINKKEFAELIRKRVEYYRANPKVYIPIDDDVFAYLHEITQGRLRYIFGLLQRLIGRLHVGDLTDRLTLDIAKPMVIKLARDRLARNKLTDGEKMILRLLVSAKQTTITMLAKQTNKSVSNISNVMSRLYRLKLVTKQRRGRAQYYMPELDASIAYRD